MSCICRCCVDFDLSCICVFLIGFTSVIGSGDLSGGLTSVIGSRGSYKTWTGIWTGMESGISARALVLLFLCCYFVSIVHGGDGVRGHCNFIKRIF